jgi:hypothetical protein
MKSAMQKMTLFFNSRHSHYAFKIRLMKLQGTPQQSRDSHLMEVAGIPWPRPITSAVYSKS